MWTLVVPYHPGKSGVLQVHLCVTPGGEHKCVTRCDQVQIDSDEQGGATIPGVPRAKLCGDLQLREL